MDLRILRENCKASFSKKVKVKFTGNFSGIKYSRQMTFFVSPWADDNKLPTVFSERQTSISRSSLKRDESRR